MRQDRYAGAVNLPLTLFTWLNLLRLLETLADPLGTPAETLSEPRADALIAWAGAAIPVEERRRLLVVARGGGTGSICSLFRMAARAGQASAATPHATGASS